MFESIDGIRNFKSADFQPSVWVPIIGVALYGVTIYGLKQVVKKPMEVKYASIVHNIILIALSAVMALGSFESLLERYEEDGADGIFCSQRPIENTLDGSAGFWLSLYFLSKFYEFGDTVLLVLKQKPTIPLHLYHHAIMAFLTWSWVAYDWLEGSLWCVLVNSIIHFFMYTYYLITTLDYEPPWWKRHLTEGQIFQFCTGFVYVCIFYYKSFTKGCGSPEVEVVVNAGQIFLPTKVIVSLPTFAVNVTFISMFFTFYKKARGKKVEKGDAQKEKKGNDQKDEDSAAPKSPPKPSRKSNRKSRSGKK